MMPIREIRKTEDGKFEIVNEEVEKADIARLRVLRDELAKVKAQAELQIAVINTNLSQVETAIATAKKEKGG